MSVSHRGDDYVQVVCACTRRRHGDASARVRIFNSDELKNTCECYPGCSEGVFTIYVCVVCVCVSVKNT